MTGSQSDYMQYRINRSIELFQDAKLLADNERWGSCVNRLYYASFHLISALLSLDGITTKSHDRLKTKFLQLYIKTNKVPIEHGKLYSWLIDWRKESDYSAFVNFEENDVLPMISKVDEFNKLLLNIIKSRL